jgi:DNA polymerase-4
VKAAARRRSILHVDLDSFFICVERSLDPSLRTRPVVIGGDAHSTGVVAAASLEAREMGVRAGQPLGAARRLCPTAAFLPGDLSAYASASEGITEVLLGASRRVERPSADEAFVDLTPESAAPTAPVPAAEAVKDELHRRLGIDASFGLASSRLAARIASAWARPRGLVVVLPGYEASFLTRAPLSFLRELPSRLQRALARAGFETLGDIGAADEAALLAAAGPAAARLRAAIRGDAEEPIALAVPPSSVQEEATIRDKASNGPALQAILDGLARRACARLRPFGLRAAAVTVEVRRADSVARRSDGLLAPTEDERTLCEVALSLGMPLLEPPGAVRSLQVRLGRLAPPGRQPTLFPEILGGRGR